MSAARRQPFAVAGDNGYGLLVSARPAAGPGSWHVQKLGVDPWNAIACPTTGLCLAGDDDTLRVAVSSDPATEGGAWRYVRIGPRTGPRAGAITSLSCPTATFCVAADNVGAIHWTTDPTGGSGDWHRVALAKSRLSSVRCRSRSLCVVADAGDQVWATSDPTSLASAWHLTTLSTGRFPITGPPAGLDAVACAPSHLCLAASRSGLAFSGIAH